MRPRSDLRGPVAVLFLLLSLAVSGCGKQADADIGSVFRLRCANCHGPTGAGDGPLAAKLGARPRNLADPQWQLTRTDEQLARVITNGGMIEGRSDLMPPHPDLAPRVVELVAWIRQLPQGNAAR